jgi:hypothetical protein
MTDAYAIPDDFGHHPGYLGAFTRQTVPGAIANGVRVRKVATDKGDANPIGAEAIVLGSIHHPDKGFAYFVEWESAPGMAVFVVGWKIAPILH